VLNLLIQLLNSYKIPSEITYDKVILCFQILHLQDEILSIYTKIEICYEYYCMNKNQTSRNYIYLESYFLYKNLVQYSVISKKYHT